MRAIDMSSIPPKVKKSILHVLLVVIFVSGIAWIILGQFGSSVDDYSNHFSGDRAYSDVLAQTSLGARIPYSPAHQEIQGYIYDQLKMHGWQMQYQKGRYLGQNITNIIASRGGGEKWVIIGAHYDSRLFADRDPEVSSHTQPVPGANDGASGVAVLLELGRVIPKDITKNVWLVFFDAEDQGRIPGWDWILGSRFFVENLAGVPDAVVIVDMIGDTDLKIYYETNSDTSLREEVWSTAHALGHEDIFIQEEKYNILDDHTPFLERGISAIDIIDFDYPYWHTLQDTADKVSSESLKIIGDTLLVWLTAP